MEVPCGDNDDCFGILFEGCRDGCATDGFGCLGGSRSECSQFIEECGIKYRCLGDERSLMHHVHGFKRICSLCSLTGQHDTICTIEDCVAREIASRNHTFLRNKHL